MKPLLVIATQLGRIIASPVKPPMLRWAHALSSSVSRAPTTRAWVPTTQNLNPQYSRCVYSSNSNNFGGSPHSIPEKIWIQLYIKGEGKCGDPYKVEIRNDISDLAAAIAKDREVDLGYCHHSKLSVYGAGAEFPPNEQDRLRPGMPVPEDTTDENPLRVVAPVVVQPQSKNCCVLGYSCLNEWYCPQ